MNTVLKIFLSMSCSGGLLILALLLGKGFLKNKISRQWQYYIWLVVILRLLLPFGPEASLLGKTYRAVDQAITQASPLQRQPYTSDDLISAVEMGQENENVNPSAEDLNAVRPLRDVGVLLTEHVWLIWLVAALVLLIRKVTIYQGFVRYLNAGLTPVSDMEILDRLSVVAEWAGIKKPVELCVSPLISSPLLTGFFHPCIILPGTDISEKDFQNIVLHELTHYKRRDMFYKWLVQVTVCLHWFNPLVYCMSREIARACEFSCDEAVLAKIGCGSAQDYGKTLLDAMAAVGKYRGNPGIVPLGENKQLLKERLGAIMNFRRTSKTVRFLTGVLTLCVIAVAAVAGVYPAAAASDQPAGKPPVSGIQNFTNVGDDSCIRDYASQAEQYYEAGSLPLFQIAFSRLDEEAQGKWLDQIYTDNCMMFWGAGIGILDEDCALIRRYAEKTYADGNIAYFSVLSMHMSEKVLEEWLNKALEDGNWAFQSVLFNALDWDDAFDELEEKREKEWEEAQAAEYGAAGVTLDGKEYYYQGQLVGIFLDIRPNKSFYTLNRNPAGTVNIKIIRDAENRITGVAYMTDAEVTELLEDMEDM